MPIPTDPVPLLIVPGAAWLVSQSDEVACQSIPLQTLNVAEVVLKYIFPFSVTVQVGSAAKFGTIKPSGSMVPDWAKIKPPNPRRGNKRINVRMIFFMIVKRYAATFVLVI